METELESSVWLRLQVLDLAAYFTDDEEVAREIAAKFERFCLNGAAPRDNVEKFPRAVAPS